MKEYLAGEAVWRTADDEAPPLGTKVLLLNPGGVCIVGTWADWAVAWAPLPKIPAHIKHILLEKSTMAMGIARLQKQARVDRQQACLKYMQQRSTPITALELATKLKVSENSIHNSLRPLLDTGKIIRKKIKRRSAMSNRQGWAYGYVATEIVLPTKTKKVTWHNPFNLGQS